MGIGDSWILAQRLGTSNCEIESICYIGDGAAVVGVSNSPNSEIWKTVNYGDSWSKVQTFAGITNIFCIKICNGTLLAGTATDGGVWSGGSSGNSWTRIGFLPGQTECRSILSLGGVLIAGSGIGGDLFNSTDGGETWVKTHDLTSYFVFDLLKLPSGTILAAGSGGVFRSVDGGATYAGVGCPQTYGLCLVGGGVILAACTSGWVYRSVNDGLTWTLAQRLGASVICYCIVYAGGGVCFAGTYDLANVYKSVDNGLTWSFVVTLGSQDTPPRNNGEIMCMAFCDGERLIAPTGPWEKIYKTGALPIPVSAFTGYPVSGDVPLLVLFTDESTNMPTSWLWDFGDGFFSAEKNPSHTYETQGVYDVSLRATNAGGSNLLLKPDYITVITPLPHFHPQWSIRIGPD